MPIAANLYYSLSARGAADRPTLVLIHGAGGSHLALPADLRRLSGWNVLAVDLPGHGRSSGAGLQSIKGYADHLMNFLDELGLYQIILAGHSMGGAIALQVALDQPSLVAGLGLVSSGAYLGVPPELLEAAADPVTRPQALGLFQRLAFSPETAPGLIEQCMRLMQEERSSVWYSDLQACAAFDLSARVAEITCPAWVAIGADDRLTPLAYAHFLAATLPHAQLEVIPSAGHMVILEKPAALAESLRGFLESNYRY
jgi:pimeloyl-ACP methyl ester carboxylesterase